MKRNKKIQQKFDFFLKDFEEDAEHKIIEIKITETRSYIQEFKIEAPECYVMHPFIVFIAFKYLKKYRYYGRDEKVAWRIPIKYRGIPFVLTHEKFGFSIKTNYESEDITQKAIEAVLNIKKAIPFIEVLFEDFIRGEVNVGNVTIINQYQIIKERYTFFRVKAKQQFEKIKKIEKEDWSKANFKKRLKYQKEGENYATAMLDSYFSLIEHLFVLLLPFMKHLTVESIILEEFIGFNWKVKFSTIIPLTGTVEALKLYERIKKIKDDFRNPLTHGYFHRDGHSLLVHIPSLGAIPVTLTKENKSLNYRFLIIKSSSFDDICSCFDDFDKFLETESGTKFGVQFIKTGLQIDYNKESNEIYKSVMTTDKEFKEFIAYKVMEETNADNMDW